MTSSLNALSNQFTEPFGGSSQRDEIALPHHGIVECRNHRTRPWRSPDGELQRPFPAGFDDLLEAGDPALHLTHLGRNHGAPDASRGELALTEHRSGNAGQLRITFGSMTFEIPSPRHLALPAAPEGTSRLRAQQAGVRSLHRSGSTDCSSASMLDRLIRTYSGEAAEYRLHHPRPESSNRPQSCAVLHLASRVPTCAPATSTALARLRVILPFCRRHMRRRPRPELTRHNRRLALQPKRLGFDPVRLEHSGELLLDKIAKRSDTTSAALERARRYLASTRT